MDSPRRWGSARCTARGGIIALALLEAGGCGWLAGGHPPLALPPTPTGSPRAQAVSLLRFVAEQASQEPPGRTRLALILDTVVRLYDAGETDAARRLLLEGSQDAPPVPERTRLVEMTGTLFGAEDARAHLRAMLRRAIAQRDFTLARDAIETLTRRDDSADAAPEIEALRATLRADRSQAEQVSVGVEIQLLLGQVEEAVSDTLSLPTALRLATLAAGLNRIAGRDPEARRRLIGVLRDEATRLSDDEAGRPQVFGGLFAAIDSLARAGAWETAAVLARRVGDPIVRHRFLTQLAARRPPRLPGPGLLGRVNLPNPRRADVRPGADPLAAIERLLARGQREQARVQLDTVRYALPSRAGMEQRYAALTRIAVLYTRLGDRTLARRALDAARDAAWESINAEGRAMRLARIAALRRRAGDEPGYREQVAEVEAIAAALARAGGQYAAGSDAVWEILAGERARAGDIAGSLASVRPIQQRPVALRALLAVVDVELYARDRSPERVSGAAVGRSGGR